ncbi:DUF3223 domain-containing protein [Paenarthrobacter aurescens]|uniref:DUF3223 domain-containing protein n=1 Tax=Paenarthrobacter aurescens TaxID=43663 RepID=A0A4Y3NA78_PAEAU|nr:DUF3223 domain-containing protein [Paenarthrobacter aurescens]MDO6143366.1 DCL family protein [Paenarthrobacter aurescens]MDO6147214.1 DCL family protein [Paenarthrobacter aurescens]MDO6158458.1 DCL family protein [Paenarthrobacter aurescens]MDO6162442.1 DCL family protein [Paenarthrobacter aurescens]GEB18183.1 hypothetical protein AAU01_09380 [Paenarthrobacter aurescens]
MAASRPIVFGNYRFSSENKAKEECKRIRDKYTPDGRVSDPADDAFFRALVDEHRHRDEKVGAGIEYFQVRRNGSLKARSGNYGVWIKQRGVDDLIDFGYGGVIRGLADVGGARQEQARVDRALRLAIRPVTDEFLASWRESGKPLISCLSGEILHSGDAIDVVHDMPRWGELVRGFVARFAETSAIETRRLDQSLGEVIVSEEIRSSWIQYHRDHAVLGLATPQENAARSR